MNVDRSCSQNEPKQYRQDGTELESTMQETNRKTKGDLEMSHPPGTGPIEHNVGQS